jgi:glycosyltransferase involved in cell wall biosynthesis
VRVAIVGGYAPNFVPLRGRLTAALAARGHSVVAVLEAPIDDATRAAIEGCGAECATHSLVAAGITPWRDLRAVFKLARLFRRERIDCVLVYNPKPMVWGAIGAWIAGVRRKIVLVTGRGSVLIGEATVVRRAYLALLRLALRRANHVMFQNEDDRALFSSLSIAPRVPTSRAMGSGVDLEAFNYRAPSETSEFVFLFVGRLLADKGIREFVASAERARALIPAARFRVSGRLDANPSAVAPSELKEWTAHGLVEFVGEPKDIRETIAAASVVVLPSYAEGIPRVVLEAMAIGRCVVTTDAPGCRDTVEDGVSGRLVPPKRVDELVAVFCELERDRHRVRMMGVAARQRAEALFDVREVNRHTIAVIEGGSLPGAAPTR